MYQTQQEINNKIISQNRVNSNQNIFQVARERSEQLQNSSKNSNFWVTYFGVGSYLFQICIWAIVIFLALLGDYVLVYLTSDFQQVVIKKILGFCFYVLIKYFNFTFFLRCLM